MNPIHQKVNESHITLVLQAAKEAAANEFRLKKDQQNIDWKQSISDRVFELVVLAAFVGMIVFVIRTFQNQTTILVPILTGVGGLFTGFLAGIGYGKRAKPSDRQ